MIEPLKLPFFQGLIPAGLAYPSVVTVEFDPDSLWQEVAFTIGAQALAQGRKVTAHVFQRSPEEVKTTLTLKGIDVASFLKSDQLRIIDSYSVQLDLGGSSSSTGHDAAMMRSLRLFDWGEAVKKQIVAGGDASDRDRLYLAGNVSVLASYNSEAEIAEFWRTRMIPLMRARGSILVGGLLRGVSSDIFYRQMESLSDVILEVRAAEGQSGLEHSLRIKALRGKAHDSTWQHLALSETGEASLSSSQKRSLAAQLDSTQLIATLDPDGSLQNFLSSLSELDSARYRVVGSYTRFDEATRNSLKDFSVRVVSEATSESPAHGNFLVWAPPGSGKTFLVHEIAASRGESLHFREINLAQTDEKTFRNALEETRSPDRPLLVFVDEVDSKPSEPWPYEALLPILEPAEPRSHSVVFILAGSAGASPAEFQSGIRGRPKGNDLLSRIPTENFVTLPPMTPEDRMLAALGNLQRAAEAEGRGISEIEKLALCYVALSPRLANPRQMREFILRGLERTPPEDDRFKFDNLFAAGDTESKEFWMGVRSVNPQLVGRFVRIAG